MPIDFHDQKNRFSYGTREADESWMNCMEQLTDWKGKTVVDVGCGGGIYSKALVKLGVEKVIGLDFSEEMLSAARLKNADEKIDYRQGNAYETGLPSSQFDIVFSRAVIHHLSDLPQYFQEAFRILKPGGMIITQDRTVEDCLLPGSMEHLRGYFFEKFPRLAQLENNRRHESRRVIHDLLEAGFSEVETISIWETRKTYHSFEEFAEDLRNRTGRSILHELDDQELAELIDFMAKQAGTASPIIEKDRWTVWIAKKPL